jgi:hypothetical protein
MPAEYVNGNVRAFCPECGALTTFEQRVGGQGYGSFERAGVNGYGGKVYATRVYLLLRCAGCGRGGFATVHSTGGPPSAMSEFYPMSVQMEPLPNGTPNGIVAEYREAERCAGIGAWRAASALLRSALEKTLIANGYTNGRLQAWIDTAAGDGVITAALQRRAHEDIRVLGNDVLHDEWREVNAEEYEVAHCYVQRIVEALYDTRAQVEAILIQRGRIPAA